MPRQDKTGPEGIGSMTGRGLGSCGRGMIQGRNLLGRGMERGWGWINQPWTKEDEKTTLDQEEKTLTEELAQVRKEKEALRGQKS